MPILFLTGSKRQFKLCSKSVSNYQNQLVEAGKLLKKSHIFAWFHCIFDVSRYPPAWKRVDSTSSTRIEIQNSEFCKHVGDVFCSCLYRWCLFLSLSLSPSISLSLSLSLFVKWYIPVFGLALLRKSSILTIVSNVFLSFLFLELAQHFTLQNHKE